MAEFKRSVGSTTTARKSLRTDRDSFYLSLSESESDVFESGVSEAMSQSIRQ